MDRLLNALMADERTNADLLRRIYKNEAGSAYPRYMYVKNISLLIEQNNMNQDEVDALVRNSSFTNGVPNYQEIANKIEKREYVLTGLSK